jgi:hypothetical protein
VGKRSPDTVAKTPQEAVILASIVEKETGKPAERKMVAGLYSNRLRKGMLLQADPTIIYPITRGKPLGRRIRQSEIQAVNDYNTYSMTGLPKGPSPIRAAPRSRRAAPGQDGSALHGRRWHRRACLCRYPGRAQCQRRQVVCHPPGARGSVRLALAWRAAITL